MDPRRVQMSEITEERLEEIEALFVQTAARTDERR